MNRIVVKSKVDSNGILHLSLPVGLAEADHDLHRLAPPEQAKLGARIKQESPSDIAICSAVVGELIYGAERAPSAHRANNRMRVEQLRQQFVSAPFDDSAAEEYGKAQSHATSPSRFARSLMRRS